MASCHHAANAAGVERSQNMLSKIFIELGNRGLRTWNSNWRRPRLWTGFTQAFESRGLNDHDAVFFGLYDKSSGIGGDELAAQGKSTAAQIKNHTFRVCANAGTETNHS
jgi:hypothetical protein